MAYKVARKLDPAWMRSLLRRAAWFPTGTLSHAYYPARRFLPQGTQPPVAGGGQAVLNGGVVRV